jgi:hypothetical protein
MATAKQKSQPPMKGECPRFAKKNCHETTKKMALAKVEEKS